jgi:hypothetical protein
MDVACWIMCFPHIPRERLAKPESGGIDSDVTASGHPVSS